MHQVRRVSLLIFAALAASLLAGCGEDTYKADPKTSTASPKGGRVEKD